jgi:hypothetical protein
MRYAAVTAAALPPVLPARLAHLETFGTPMRGGRRWPSSTRAQSNDWLWPTWCNGTAGFVHLWAQAYESYGDPAYLEWSSAAAFFVGQSIDASRPTHICCGLAGQAFALARHARLTDEARWGRRLDQIADATASLSANRIRRGRPAHGLYKGTAGEALLYVQMRYRDAVRMPLLETLVPGERREPYAGGAA